MPYRESAREPHPVATRWERLKNAFRRYTSLPDCPNPVYQEDASPFLDGPTHVFDYCERWCCRTCLGCGYTEPVEQWRRDMVMPDIHTMFPEE